MRFFRIGLQITLLTLFIAAAVIASGYLVYQSLSQIIDSIHKEARPDFKLIVLKEIASDLNEVESSIRLYSLTGGGEYLSGYRDHYRRVQENLKVLQDYAVPDSPEVLQIDSIRKLSTRKLVIWGEIRNLHSQKLNKPSAPLTELVSKIDTFIIRPDTIKFEPEKKKKGFFKRLFAKRDTTTRAPIIIDKAREKQLIKQEIVQIEQQMSTEKQELASKERKLYEANLRVTDQINGLIGRMETDEQRRLEKKTEEADFMAAEIYRRLILFTGASVVLLIIVLVLFFRNLQKNRAYQNMLSKARTDAENLAKAKERFVATVSHEMRTPVNAIYGLSEQMLQRVADSSLKQDLNIVHKSADHLITLVNDTLDFSKIESKTLRFEQTDFLPNELFREVITLHQVPAKAKGLELELSTSIPEHRVFRGDPVRLKQILINLLTNAIKFTPRGTVSLIAAEEKMAGQHFKLLADVADSGIGIPGNQLQHIFDEFVQLDNDPAQKHRGAGLGLAIVKRLVDLQGGQISVKSLVGRGTRFKVEIPYPEGNPALFGQQQAAFEIPSWFAELNLLIVDDEEFNLYLLKNILNKWHVGYTEARNGQEAVDCYRQQPFDLVLMDVRMPVMDGYAAAAQIIAFDPNASIVALTAGNQPGDSSRPNQPGISRFLQKPFPERALYDLLIETGKPKKRAERRENTVVPEVTNFDLDELRNSLGGDESFFAEMVGLFIESAQKCRSVFSNNLENPDEKAVAEAAHKLAAPARHMQAVPLYNLLKKLENDAETGINREAIGLAIAEIDRFTAALKQALGR